MRGTFVITLTGAVERIADDPSLLTHPPARSPARPFVSPHESALVLSSLAAPRKLAAPACARSLLARVEARCGASGYVTEIGGLSVLAYADTRVCEALASDPSLTHSHLHLELAAWLSGALENARRAFAD